MCGITGQISLSQSKIPQLPERLAVMIKLIAHRGPDGEGFWYHPRNIVGFGHLRLSVIDLETGKQPISSPNGSIISFNGELYNYKALRTELEHDYQFKTTSDTEVVLAAYLKWKTEAIHRLRGMFAFSLWDEEAQTLFCARDRFGIKPLYYCRLGDQLLFASEAKALLPYLPQIETDQVGLQQYFTFQYCLGSRTLFKGVEQLEPGHYLLVRGGKVEVHKYWEPQFTIDWDHTSRYFEQGVSELVRDSILHHMVSDVPVGAYLSGGIDSSLVAILAKRVLNENASALSWGGRFKAFTGKFSLSNEYDESHYARTVANENDIDLYEIDITSDDFIENISKVIYHLDYPVAGPGSFPQYLVSQLASKHLKVCLGGQGGDEIFGGYVRYLLAYFEQCIKGAIEGTMHSGNFIVTYESIIPNLRSLQNYMPLMKDFWSSGLFDDRERRYFRLISRSESIRPLLRANYLAGESVFETFREIFCGKNVEHASYFDCMTNFDFKTLLPALLQVEDRMSAAHGLESRVPFLDHPLIEFAATIPSNVKFENGQLKHLIRRAFKDDIPAPILARKDKMGFPVPLGEWFRGTLRDFVVGTLSDGQARDREYLRDDVSLADLIQREGKFDRNIWGLLSLELWQQQYHDRGAEFRGLLEQSETPERRQAVGE